MVRVLTSCYCFASDLDDAGVEAVLDDLQGRAGVGGVTLATAYHAARDLFPHARGRRLRFLPGGETHLVLDDALWAGRRLVPRSTGAETLGELVAAAGRRGMHVDGWTVFLHVDREHDLPPGLAEETCFGDPVPTQLCPANPEVRAYAVGLAREVARRGVRAVVAESLHFHGLAHGYHHERYFVPLSPTARLLLGTCFCVHCRARVPDGDQVRDAVAAAVQGELDGGPALARLPARLLGPYLAARAATVASLVAEVAAACRAEGAELVFLDGAGAAKGYATGRPRGGPAAGISWQAGVDLAAVAQSGAAIGVIAYAADPLRVGLDLDAYRAAAGPDATLEAVLRPVPPDAADVANLAAKVALCKAGGVRGLGFYHYGLVPLPALDRIREALRTSA